MSDALEQPHAGRLVFSLMQPVVRIAARLGISLDEMSTWLELAYFAHLRKQGLTLKECADRLDIGMRTASRLSKALKTDFFAPEREHDLPRRIEFLLWTGESTEGRLLEAMKPTEAEDVLGALDRLVAEGRVEREEGRAPLYRIVRGSERLVRPDWRSRIGALNSLGRTVAATVGRRFLDKDDRAFARTLVLRVAPERVQELKEIYETAVWERLEALDQDAAGNEDAVPMQLSILWAPSELEEEE